MRKESGEKQTAGPGIGQPAKQPIEEPLSETLENYIEAIYKIIIVKNGVRVKDIARTLGVKNSSVVSALKALSKGGYINYEPYGIISLTPEGNSVARRLTEKNRILRYFFEQILGLSRKGAEESACGMEHSLSEEAFKRLTQFIKYTYVTHKNDSEWLDGFKAFYPENPMSPNCDECIDDYFEDVGGLGAGPA